MRDILFRAKVKNSNDLVFGYYVKKNEIHYIYDIDICAFVKIDHNTLCQFTGLCDKNGTKIFEGDIVVIKDDDDELYTVKFDECCFQLDGYTVCYVMDNFYDHDLEVIGNIHDNPELLKGGE